MKKKTKIILIATTLTVLSLTIIFPRTLPQEPPQQPNTRPVSALVDSIRDNTTHQQDNAIVSDEQPKTSTQSEVFSEPIVAEPVSA